ncbi:DUF7319 domain-containing protein [Halomicrobium katesii]|uniref:DUF7319 domain-containing protein n=1 Tax=Halomicrobium katesii TaxID=437163 RepID=UPI00037B1E99|nr:hypothetical protein [Halomicrobium katesii]
MADPQSTPPGDDADQQGATADSGVNADGEQSSGPATDEASVEALRAEVEEKYDFDDFGPEDMAKMTAEEWEVAFEEESWITGGALLDRVADDLRSRVATREVFARVERHTDPQRVLAYSDEGYALVFPDGTVEGHGTVLRDVKPTVALCSMDDYDVPEPPSDDPLPEPDEVPEGGTELGNWMLQLIAGVQLLAGLVLIGGGILAAAGQIGGAGASPVLLIVGGLAFLAIALVLFLVVANARLSDKFRSEEYRDRLRAIGLSDGERPEFVPALEPDGSGEGEDGQHEG